MAGIDLTIGAIVAALVAINGVIQPARHSIASTVKFVPTYFKLNCHKRPLVSIFGVSQSEVLNEPLTSLGVLTCEARM